MIRASRLIICDDECNSEMENKKGMFLMRGYPLKLMQDSVDNIVGSRKERFPPILMQGCTAKRDETNRSLYDDRSMSLVLKYGNHINEVREIMMRNWSIFFELGVFKSGTDSFTYKKGGDLKILMEGYHSKKRGY